MKAEMIVFFAGWCPKCGMMMPIVEKIKHLYAEVLSVKKIDVEKESEIAGDYSIQIVPTFVIMKERQEIARMAGIIAEETFIERIETMLKNEER